MPSSRGSFRFRDRILVFMSPALAGGSFITGTTWEAWRSTHVVANNKIVFFFYGWLFSIVCVCMCVFIIIWPNILTHSSFDGHLGCFCILAIVNNAEVNIPCQISISLFFSADNPHGIAGSYSGSIFSFFRKLHMFSTVAAPIYIPAKSAQGFLFSTFLWTLVVSCLSDDSHSPRCVVTSRGFDLRFSDDQWCWASLHVPIVWKNVCSNLPIF